MQLLRTNRNFRRIWLGEVVSNFGDWFTVIASAALIGGLTGSGAAVGLLFGIRMLAPFMVSPLAGVLADRYNRKSIMIASDLSRAVVVLGFLFVREPGDVWLLYALTAVQLALSGMFVPARSAILAEIVPAEQLAAANTLSSATYAVMQTVGAGVGGLLSGILGVYETFLIDAASFVFSALVILPVAYRPVTAVSKRTVAHLSRQYADGLRYLRRDPESRYLSLHKAVNALFITGGLNVIMVALAIDRFPIGADAGISIGLIFCATGIGTALGPILARRVTRDRTSALRKGLVVCYLISAVGLVTAAPAVSLGLALAGLVIRGLGGGMMFVFSTQLLMTRVPNAVQGRVFSTEFALRTLAGAIGTVAVSVLLDVGIGTSGVLLIVAASALIPGLLWWRWISVTPEPAPVPAVGARPGPVRAALTPKQAG